MLKTADFYFCPIDLPPLLQYNCTMSTYSYFGDLPFLFAVALQSCAGCTADGLASFD